VVVVRHAEKANDDPSDPSDPSDPGLTEAGLQRASRLAAAISGMRPAAIYVSQFRRTQQTAEPSARAAGLSAQVIKGGSELGTDARRLADLIRSKNQGQSVLVVGHSNTVNAIVAALGGGAQDRIADDEFDRVYLVAVPAQGAVRVLVSRY